MYYQFNIRVFFFLVLLTGAKLRIHLSKKYTILYFIKLDFYFEIHFPTEVVGILNSISFIVFCLLVGHWRVLWDSEVEALLSSSIHS